MEIEEFRKRLRKTFRNCLIINGGMIAFAWYSISPIGWGGGVILPFVMAMVLFITVFPFAMPIFPISLLFLIWKRYRIRAVFWLVVSLCYGGIGYGAFMAAEAIRMHGFALLAKRSRPLIQAIQAFETQHGVPPTRLQALIPDFLPAIPFTQMPAYPQFHYETASQVDWFYGNSWTLYIPVLSGMMSFDRFFYFPLQNYPKSAYSGWIERVDDWAYAHE